MFVKGALSFKWKAYKRGTYSVQNGTKQGKGLDLGADLPCIKSLLSRAS